MRRLTHHVTVLLVRARARLSYSFTVLETGDNSAITKFYYFEFKESDYDIYPQPANSPPLPVFIYIRLARGYKANENNLLDSVDSSDRKILFLRRTSRNRHEEQSNRFLPRTDQRLLFARLTFWHSGIGFSAWRRRPPETRTYRERSRRRIDRGGKK